MPGADSSSVHQKVHPLSPSSTSSVLTWTMPAPDPEKVGRLLASCVVHGHLDRSRESGFVGCGVMTLSVAVRHPLIISSTRILA